MQELTELAVGYFRVSSSRQRADGNGLKSQEHRCRAYAKDKGYRMETVFYDDCSGGGDFWKRPGIRNLLAFLDANPTKKYKIIFDDLKRFARDTEFHFKLKRELQARGAAPECLNFAFQDSPEGEYAETILAAGAQLERKQNRRQVIQKMKARMEQGYWCLCQPPGYIYEQVKFRGSLLKKDEKTKSIITSTLNKFAEGEFSTMREAGEYINSFNVKIQSNSQTGKFTKIKELLTNPIHAGYLTYKKWGVEKVEGIHEPYISWETHERILQRIESMSTKPSRKDVREDFPLRGLVTCAECDGKCTASWSKGRSGKHPYYRCNRRHCVAYGKGIKKDDIEEKFVELLKNFTPAKETLMLEMAIIKDVWKEKMKNIQHNRTQKEAQIKKIKNEINIYLECIKRSSSASILGVYEKKIEELDKEISCLQAVLTKETGVSFDLEPALDYILEHIKSPSKQWEQGNLKSRTAIYQMIFTKPIPYDRNTGFGTASLAPTFELFSQTGVDKRSLVEMPGVEPGCKRSIVIHLQS